MPMVIAVLMALILAQANISVIFTGGVGKNGSTVAVRLLHSQPVVDVMFFIRYVLSFVPLLSASHDYSLSSISISSYSLFSKLLV